ncbi:MAG TPA: hypothetical protein DCF61_08940 [Alphaproteobacteria bacterium]|jgi:DNA-binding response OmpR family regulator|nr:hypothetical protein [Alphaproteobacteria bacterium]HAM48757.1 hypothetical protein [Alphaproteobacteria bacterium]HBA43287.1 hypothetical protein [Alphaproteobacteria bacterium]HCO89513.1 hypothetical protein [Alphaproteobacteria bacterium]
MARIVCVEDEQDIREDVAEVLAEAGHEVTQAENGRRGLETIVAVQPDLVLSDITMPDMDGHQLLVELRESHPELGDIPFIFLTALADRKDQITGRQLGADDYLTKPIDFEMMMVVVESKLEKQRHIQAQRDRQLLKLYTALTNTEHLIPTANPAAAGRAAAPAMAPMTIVSVCNAEIDLTALHTALKEEGHAVFAFRSGREFLDQASRLDPDILLIGFNTTDLQAPLVVNMLRRETGRTYPVILLMPPDMPDFPVDNTMRGFDAKIRAPVDKAAMLQQIRDIISIANDDADDLMAAL